MKRKILLLLSFFALLGITDSGYLTYEHFSNIIPPCTVNQYLPIISDCGKVLRSSYSVVFGIPLALFGVLQYLTLLMVIIAFFISQKKILAYWILFQSNIGAIFSLYFMYLQLIVLKSICIYCTLSALISFIILFFSYKVFSKERFFIRLSFLSFLYEKILKPVFFLMDAEFIHETMITVGEIIGKTFIRNFFNFKLNYQSKKLKQNIVGINYRGPVGLAAGFDYNGQLTQVLFSLGFGFQTVGTVTNLSYEGNPLPRLGRLPKSKSLMVNKGFKNLGSKIVSKKINKLDFKIPLGISIGVSNNKKLINLEDSINDIRMAFLNFEKSRLNNSYYELNISCPNLINTKVDFYRPANLEKLLDGLKNLHLNKPVFIKMPIDKTNGEFLAILKIIEKYSYVKGVIIGNLFKDRKSLLLDKQEVKKFKIGHFSGKPCEIKSNDLIKLTYKKYLDRFVIIGCGGVFSGDDAYKKIRLGASLIQLITGMIYQGPQLISQINLRLEELLEKDGFSNMKQVIGIDVK